MCLESWSWFVYGVLLHHHAVRPQPIAVLFLESSRGLLAGHVAMASAARMFSNALHESQGQALPARGTEAPYPGSRRLALRYEYKENSRAGMVELHPERLLTREEFKKNLLAAPGVMKVFVLSKFFVSTRCLGWQVWVSGSVPGPLWEETS